MKRNAQKTSFNKKTVISVFITIAFILVLSISALAYYSPYSYVSLDVNPSIEFELNIFKRVISVKAVNDDGEEILNEINMENLSYQKIGSAIAVTLKTIKDYGYFESEDEGGIVIATSALDTNTAEEIATELEEEVTKEVEEENATVESFCIGRERVQEAKRMGVTPGKLNIVEKLQAFAGDSENINIDEWLSKPVKDIMKEIKKYRKASVVVIPDENVEEETPEDTPILPDDQSTEDSIVTEDETTTEVDVITEEENTVDDNTKWSQFKEDLKQKLDNIFNSDDKNQEHGKYKGKDNCEKKAIQENRKKEMKDNKEQWKQFRKDCPLTEPDTNPVTEPDTAPITEPETVPETESDTVS